MQKSISALIFVLLLGITLGPTLSFAVESETTEQSLATQITQAIEEHGIDEAVRLALEAEHSPTLIMATMLSINISGQSIITAMVNNHVSEAAIRTAASSAGLDPNMVEATIRTALANAPPSPPPPPSPTTIPALGGKVGVELYKPASASVP